MSDPYCPNCKQLTVTIQPEVRWCESCGTILHPTGKAWFCQGKLSTPHLVTVVRERENILDEPGTLNAIRYHCGLGQIREVVG